MSHRKKLIEVALPLEAINAASAREKSIRHGHPSTLHLWWARRPLAAARAVIFASLVDDPGHHPEDQTEPLSTPPEFIAACRQLPKGKNAEGVDEQGRSNDTPRMRLFDFIERLVLWESTTDERVLATARELIRLSTGGNPPPLLDPFAGGGSIPLEAQRLGLEAHASDLNPVAVMINKALIEIPPRFADMPPVNPTDRSGTAGSGGWKGAAGLAADVRYYGQWMRDRAFERIGHLYPDYSPPPQPSPLEGGSPTSPHRGEAGRGATGETVIAWLWARTVRCPNPACGAMMPLVRSFDLSKKKGRRAWVVPHITPPPQRGGTRGGHKPGGGPPKITFDVKSNQQGRSKAPDGTVNRRGATCIACETPVPFDHIRDEGKAGRMSAQLMAIVTEGSRGRNYYSPDEYHVKIAKQAKPAWQPDHPLPHNPRDFKTPNYGMKTFADLFTLRQLTALTTFSDLVAEARRQIEADARAAWGEMPSSTPPQPSPAEELPPLNPPRWGGSFNSSPQRATEGRAGRGAIEGSTSIWAPTPVPPHLLEAARRLRREMTDAEQLLWQCLRRKQLGGFRFRKQHPLERFVLDFYCPAARLAVELDGGQHNTPQGIASDEERTAILQQHGIKVIRFWNNEVVTNLEGVLQEIYTTLQIRVSGDVPPPQPSPAGDVPPPQPSPAGGGSQTSPPAGGIEGGLPLRDGGRGPTAYAEAVSVYLAFAVDKGADHWSSIASWRNSVEAHRSTFARQALPMVWDFVEVNPFSNSAGNWNDACIDLLDKAITATPNGLKPGRANQVDAASGDSRSSQLTAISTDPPYYDNIGYADLSDYSYAWLRKNLRSVYPDIFGTVLVPKEPELVATPYRFNGDKAAAEKHFEDGLNQTFHQLRRIASHDYPLTVYYAFKQQEIAVEEGTASTGWETMLTGLINTGFQIVGTWPVRTERGGRMISVGTNALASSIVLVCRPRPAEAPLTSRREFVNALRRELPAALREMQSGNIAPVDLAQASIGPGMAVYSRYSQVLEPDGSRLTVRAALQLINHELDAYLAEQEGDIDADSRFAVAWFEQFGFKEAGFGQADVLARAKNTSVDGLANAGVLESGAGKVRLIPWEELDPEWDPASDRRLTVWEATHHLIERLNHHGEQGAAMLLAKMPPDLAAEARQLAYRLYSICERKSWAEHARDYNALVISWSASQEQAVKFKEQYRQGRLM